MLSIIQKNKPVKNFHILISPKNNSRDKVLKNIVPILDVGFSEQMFRAQKAAAADGEVSPTSIHLCPA